MEAPQDRPVRLISEDEYQQFVQRIEGAENQDRAEKLGIWHSSLRFNDVVAIFLDDFVLDDAYSRVRPAASEASKTFELDCRIGTTGDIRPTAVEWHAEMHSGLRSLKRRLTGGTASGLLHTANQDGRLYAPGETSYGAACT